jgi:hypothetical protein
LNGQGRRFRFAAKVIKRWQRGHRRIRRSTASDGSGEAVERLTFVSLGAYSLFSAAALMQFAALCRLQLTSYTLGGAAAG